MVQIMQRELRVVQLSVTFHDLDNRADDLTQPLLALRILGPAARLTGIRQHQDGRLAGTWPGTGIAELLRVHLPGITAGALHGLHVLIARHHRAVVLEDEILDAARQAVLA